MGKENENKVDDKTLPEPSIGPACLVIAILLLATFCAVCGIGSWFMFSDQYPLAQRGIQEQLIPWIEQSELSTADKTSIVRQLQELLPRIRERSIDSQQLSRLRNCLQDNPVLLWGVVQSIQAQARALAISETPPADGTSKFTEVEVATLDNVAARLLENAAQRKLGRADLEFAVQKCSLVKKGEDGIQSKPNLDAESIREFIKRAEQLISRPSLNEKPGDVKPRAADDKPYDKSPAEAFETLVKAALTVEPKK
jgi:hypothetical protein